MRYHGRALGESTKSAQDDSGEAGRAGGAHFNSRASKLRRKGVGCGMRGGEADRDHVLQLALLHHDVLRLCRCPYPRTQRRNES